MGKSKKYVYEWEDFEDGSKNAKTMAEEIVADPELAQLDSLTVGCWGESWDNEVQPIIDAIVENQEKFTGITTLFVGDMDFEECEVSWIEQGNYEKIWEAMPQLESLTIKGATNLSLGNIQHNNLKKLEIICGGLPKEVLESIAKAKLPNLESLVLYLGVEDYGFDGDIEDVKAMVETMDFPKLTSLGIVDSELEDEIVEIVMSGKYASQVEELSFAYGTLTDKGGAILIEKLPQYTNIQKLDLEWHFMSDDMMKKLEALEEKLDIEINLTEQQEEEEWDDEIYRYPMLTE